MIIILLILFTIKPHLISAPNLLHQHIIIKTLLKKSSQIFVITERKIFTISKIFLINISKIFLINISKILNNSHKR